MFESSKNNDPAILRPTRVRSLRGFWHNRDRVEPGTVVTVTAFVSEGLVKRGLAELVTEAR